MASKYPVLEQCAHCDKIYRGYSYRLIVNQPVETRCKSCWEDVRHHHPKFYAECVDQNKLSPKDPPFHFPG